MGTWGKFKIKLSYGILHLGVRRKQSVLKRLKPKFSVGERVEWKFNYFYFKLSSIKIPSKPLKVRKWNQFFIAIAFTSSFQNKWKKKIKSQTFVEPGCANAGFDFIKIQFHCNSIWINVFTNFFTVKPLILSLPTKSQKKNKIPTKNPFSFIKNLVDIFRKRVVAPVNCYAW